MSQKQKVFVGVILIVVMVLFGIIYAQFSSPVSTRDASSVNTVRSNQQKEKNSSETVSIPATPDAAVDAIVNDATLDEQALQDDAANEQEAIIESGEDINNLTQTYDENQL